MTPFKNQRHDAKGRHADVRPHIPNSRAQPRRALIPCLFAVLALLAFAPPEATAQTVTQYVYIDSPLIPDANNDNTPSTSAPGSRFGCCF